MAQIDTYRMTLSRKRDELVKLKQDLAREQGKISPLQRKIISANDAIKRTKIASIEKSKLREIEQANKLIADIQKKCAVLQDKIAKKEKEVTAAEKNCMAEEAKLNKKAAEAEKSVYKKLPVKLRHLKRLYNNRKQCRQKCNRR